MNPNFNNFDKALEGLKCTKSSVKLCHFLFLVNLTFYNKKNFHFFFKRIKVYLYIVLFLIILKLFAILT